MNLALQQQKQYQAALIALMSKGFTFMAAGRKLIEQERQKGTKSCTLAS